MQLTDGRDLLSTLEAAQLLGVKRDTVAGWAKKGMVKAIRMSNAYFIERSEVERIGRAASTRLAEARVLKGRRG